MNERMNNYLKGLTCVKRGRYHTVYFNPQNGDYEIWDRFEQCEVIPSKAEALDTMKYLDKHYLSDL